jgi:FAD/FMN-containing dehydrogenase
VSPRAAIRDHERVTEPPIVSALRLVLPTDRILADPGLTAGYAHDEAEWAPHEVPVAVVRARTTDDIAATVRACAEHTTPVVPRGAGTGLSGGANAVSGCVVLSLEAMRDIVEIDPGERLAVVQPGVVNDDLRSAVVAERLWYPPDPASALVDRHCLRAVRDWKRMDLPDGAAALLLAQTDLPEPAAEHEAAAILVEFERAGAKEALASTDQVEAEALFDARRLAYPALEQRGEAILTEDVCLPRGRWPPCSVKSSRSDCATTC